MGRVRSGHLGLSPRRPVPCQAAFTLIELMVGAAVLATAIVALLGAFLGQSALNEQSRNFSWAMTDAARVMERLRQQNSGGLCTLPSVGPPVGFASWDAWLNNTSASGGGGKSVQPAPDANELVVVSSLGSDPLRVTVAVCWRHRGRIIGECGPDGAQLIPSDLDGNGTITAAAMLSTMLTCRR